MSDRDPPGAPGLPGDAEHDAWLREALRHAPDAAAVPPAHVSQAILAEARAAARPPTASPRAAASKSTALPWLAFWAWLARPPVAAGFASVMAATLVGMMWWGRPIEDPMPRPEAPLQTQASPARRPAVSPMNETPAAAPPPAPTEATPDKALAKPREASRDERVEKRPEESMRLGPKTREAEQSAKRESSEPARPSGNVAGAAAPAAPPPPEALADASIGSPPAPAPTPSPAPAPRPAAAPLARAAMPGRAEAKRSADAFVADPLQALAASPLAPVLAALRDAPAAWSRLDANSVAPVGPELQRRLAELDTEAAGHWSPSEARPVRATADPAALVLQRDGAATVVLRIDGSVLTLDSALDGQPRSWRAELPAAAAERARSARPWPR